MCVCASVRLYVCACVSATKSMRQNYCAQSCAQATLNSYLKRMSSDQKIADIKRQLGEAVNRIENIQGGRQRPLLSKISHHLRAQGGSLVNVVLTASVFAVAFGRLQQKQQHEARST